MSSIFTVNKENAPITHGLKEGMPSFMHSLIFDYDISTKGGRSTFMHISRSAIKIGCSALFMVAALVEKAARFILTKCQEGIDKVFTKKQQEEIQEKFSTKAYEALDAGKGFIQRHFSELFSS